MRRNIARFVTSVKCLLINCSVETLSLLWCDEDMQTCPRHDRCRMQTWQPHYFLWHSSAFRSPGWGTSWIPSRCGRETAGPRPSSSPAQPRTCRRKKGLCSRERHKSRPIDLFGHSCKIAPYIKWHHSLHQADSHRSIQKIRVLYFIWGFILDLITSITWNQRWGLLRGKRTTVNITVSTKNASWLMTNFV